MNGLRTLGVLLLVTATACSANGKDTSAARPAPYAGLYQGLCVARASAARPTAARRAFFDRAHQPIHELAAVVAASDRATAGRLLEAKQSVERDLAAEATALAGDLDRLLAAASRAIVVTGQPAPQPCPEAP